MTDQPSADKATTPSPSGTQVTPAVIGESAPAATTGSPASPTTVALTAPPARWLHRWSVVIIALIWPLIWVGGQVTTYDAGMAVPDWPGTYGYNLFLYPYQTWLLGPFDLFIEHGHRLLGALVGIVSIVAVGFAWTTEPRRWVRWLSIAILLAVVAQGGLGGARVLLSDRTLAMLHGCSAPLVFSLGVVVVVATSRWWWAQGQITNGFQPSKRLVTAVAALVGCSYLQVLLGAQLRHLQPTASPTGFSHLVNTHIATAFVVLTLATLVGWRLSRGGATRPVVAADGTTPPEREKPSNCGDLTLSIPAWLLLTFVVLQISLGLATWVARYGVPPFAQIGPKTASFLVQSQAFGQSLIITGHVAVGSLVLVTSVYLLLRLLRARYTRHPIAVSS